MIPAVRRWAGGAALGIAFAAAITLARRWTWRPYEPIHLPYDVAVCGIAGVVLALLAPRLYRPGARLSRISFAALIAAIPILAWCALGPRPRLLPSIASPATRPVMKPRSVVLVVLDTLRRSNLALHGYGRRTTPNLDRWAERALVFDQATSVSSWTMPAHASMFTGLYPRSHGAHGYRSGKQKESTYRLPDACDTLAEIVSRAGLSTAAVVANHLYLEPRFGTDQGFGVYFVDPPRPGFRFPPADALVGRLDPRAADALEWPYLRDTFVTDAALDAVEQLRGQPFFLFVNYLDVHRPNDRPPTPEVPEEDELVVPRYFPELTSVLRGEPIDPRVKRSLVNAYDRELQHLDGELARLLARLAEADLAEETLVIVTSDHGEHFGEHGLVDHAALLYDEVVHVPLLLRGPGIVPGRRADPVSLVDVFPTALEFLGLPVPEACQGASLLQAPGPREIVSEWYAAANGFLLHSQYRGRFDHDLRSIRIGRWRLLEDATGRIELFDLEADPRELADRAIAEPATVAELRARLAAWEAGHPAGESVPLGDAPTSRERSEALRRTGYAGEDDSAGPR
jgi:arylsulfatase A-like enzyme